MTLMRAPPTTRAMPAFARQERPSRVRPSTTATKKERAIRKRAPARIRNRPTVRPVKAARAKGVFVSSERVAMAVGVVQAAMVATPAKAVQAAMVATPAKVVQAAMVKAVWEAPAGAIRSIPEKKAVARAPCQVRPRTTPVGSVWHGSSCCNLAARLDEAQLHKAH